ncbi:MAG: toxin HicA [Spirochaetia bacterium]|jgi:hypothetical protein|nr:toxin HicA [Spirochaetia bacterium]
MYQKQLKNPKNVKFNVLIKICTEKFGEPRISGGHFMFSMPWEGDPYINLQTDKKTKKMAKPYQVKQVIKALKKLEDGSYGSH